MSGTSLHKLPSDGGARYEGWAILEMMGHRTEIGYITTEYFGAAAMFRVDMPDLPDREYTLEAPEWTEQGMAPKGAVVKRRGVEGRSVLVAPGSLYALNPCTEEAAMKAIEGIVGRRPLMCIGVPEGVKMIGARAAHDPEEDHDEEED